MRITRYAATLAAFGLLLSGCSSNAGNQAADSSSSTGSVATDVSFEAGTTMAKLNEAGKITVGTKNITWTETVSANREQFIKDGRVDYVVATYTINDTRKQQVDFAGPYYEAGQDIMVAKGNPEKIKGPDDLAGKNVCSVEGSTPAQNIRDHYPQATLTLFDVYSKCADALSAGQVDAVTTDNVILTGLVSGSPDKFEIVGKPFTKEPYGIGLMLGDTAFRTFINDVLEESYKDGSWADAWDRTAGKITGLKAPTPPKVNRY
jgi:glutamate transport system substrate-binding protein